MKDPIVLRPAPLSGRPSARSSHSPVLMMVVAALLTAGTVALAAAFALVRLASVR